MSQTLFLQLLTWTEVVVESWCDGSMGRSHIVDPLRYFSFHSVLHDCCNKGRGMWNGA